MANRTSWTAGNGNVGAGLTWNNAFTAGNLNSLAALQSKGSYSGYSILASTSIAKITALDMFDDISFELTIASSAVAAG